ncbi:MAG: PP2C family protein-serine/threonine phosphatase, partial [bacterium]
MAEIKQENFMEKDSDSDNIKQELANLRTKVADLSSLIEVSIIINSTLNLDELIGLVMEKAQSVMKAEACSVMLINETKSVLECAVALGEVGDQLKQSMELQLGEGIAGWVAQHGKPQIVRDVANDPRFTSKIDENTGFQTRSILAAPLMVKDKTIGVAEVINRVDGKAFDEEDLELFSTFCRQVAMAIENARMHQLELEKQKLEQQLEAAKFIQQSFMPESFPDSPEQRFSVTAKSLPAASIGGDFFDFIEIDKDTIGIAVGDVTGKGIPAALYMARLVSDFRIYTQIHKYPAQVLKALNKILVERSRRGMFVTFQYGLLNAASGKFVYANAGHIPFLRI